MSRPYAAAKKPRPASALMRLDLYFYTGLRWSEAVAFRRRSLDLTHTALLVEGPEFPIESRWSRGEIEPPLTIQALLPRKCLILGQNQELLAISPKTKPVPKKAEKDPDNPEKPDRARSVKKKL
jgi:hypothetical protein